MTEKKFRVFFSKYGYVTINGASTQEEAEKLAIRGVYFNKPLTKENAWVMLDETEEVKEN